MDHFVTRLFRLDQALTLLCETWHNRGAETHDEFISYISSTRLLLVELFVFVEEFERAGELLAEDLSKVEETISILLSLEDQLFTCMSKLTFIH